MYNIQYCFTSFDTKNHVVVAVVSLFACSKWKRALVTLCFSDRSMASVLSEEQFTCSICMDTFKSPASIPCGHNFCLKCIKCFWDTKNKAECPLCKEVFKPRPVLRVNVDLKDITEKFKRSYCIVFKNSLHHVSISYKLN